MAKLSSTVFSRILLLAGLVSASGGAYWFLSTSFAPVEVPPAPPIAVTGNMRFDPTADVSKNPAWSGLRPLTDHRIEAGEGGREDPFAPVVTNTAQ